MRVDQYGELVSEIYPPGKDYLGNLGNCMSETARYYNLFQYLGTNPPVPVDLRGFRTPTTYWQALDPECPVNWTDSSDQCLPWYISMLKMNKAYADEMKQRVKAAGYVTPDDNLVSIPFFCLVYAPWALSVIVLLQAITLRVPISWGQRTAAHLNWFQTALLCPKWVTWPMPKDTLMAQVNTYYASEPNNAGLLNLYKLAIEKRYK